MRSSKSRSRSKANRPRPLGNIVNRVFDSSGPEGKVRGTPQQIIDKYLVLARDAQLGNDRVAAENFLQHAEHYTRMLTEAQRETAREAEARRVAPGGGGNDQPHRPRGDDRDPRRDAQPEAGGPEPARSSDEDTGTLVETPEGKGNGAGQAGGGRRRRPPPPQPEASTSAGTEDGAQQAPAETAGEAPAGPDGAAEKPAPKRRAPRRPRSTGSGADAPPAQSKTSAAE